MRAFFLRGAHLIVGRNRGGIIYEVDPRASGVKSRVREGNAKGHRVYCNFYIHVIINVNAYLLRM